MSYMREIGFQEGLTGATALRDQKRFHSENFSLAGWRFEVADSGEAVAQARALRAESRLGAEGILPCPDAQTQAQMDHHSVDILARDRRDRIVGTLRMTFNSKKAVGFSGLAMAPEYEAFFQGIPRAAGPARRRSHILAMGLFRLAYKLASLTRVTIWHGTLPAEMVERLALGGFAISPVSPGEDRSAVSYLVRLPEVQKQILHPRGWRRIIHNLAGGRIQAVEVAAAAQEAYPSSLA